jgi:hypothetical protein
MAACAGVELGDVEARQRRGGARAMKSARAGRGLRGGRVVRYASCVRGPRRGQDGTSTSVQFANCVCVCVSREGERSVDGWERGVGGALWIWMFESQ